MKTMVCSKYFGSMIGSTLYWLTNNVWIKEIFSIDIFIVVRETMVSAKDLSNKRFWKRQNQFYLCNQLMQSAQLTNNQFFFGAIYLKKIPQHFIASTTCHLSYNDMLSQSNNRFFMTSNYDTQHSLLIGKEVCIFLLFEGWFVAIDSLIPWETIALANHLEITFK